MWPGGERAGPLLVLESARQRLDLPGQLDVAFGQAAAVVGGEDDLDPIIETFDHSGWWFIASAAGATRDMNSQAWLKSLNRNDFWIASRPSTGLQLDNSARARVRASAFSFSTMANPLFLRYGNGS